MRRPPADRMNMAGGTTVVWNHAMKQKKRRPVRHQPNLALLHHVSQQSKLFVYEPEKRIQRWMLSDLASIQTGRKLSSLGARLGKSRSREG